MYLVQVAVMSDCASKSGAFGGLGMGMGMGNANGTGSGDRRSSNKLGTDINTSSYGTCGERERETSLCVVVVLWVLAMICRNAQKTKAKTKRTRWICRESRIWVALRENGAANPDLPNSSKYFNTLRNIFLR